MGEDHGTPRSPWDPHTHTPPPRHCACLYSSFCLLARTKKAVKMEMATTNPATITPTATPTLLTRELQASSWYQNADGSAHLRGTWRVGEGGRG